MAVCADRTRAAAAFASPDAPALRIDAPGFGRSLFEVFLGDSTVVPEARRQGLARRLVKGAQAWAFATLPELDRLWLWTENLHALDLYERLGWTEHERLVYHGHNTVLMVCSRASYLQAASWREAAS